MENDKISCDKKDMSSSSSSSSPLSSFEKLEKNLNQGEHDGSTTTTTTTTIGGGSGSGSGGDIDVSGSSGNEHDNISKERYEHLLDSLNYLLKNFAQNVEVSQILSKHHFEKRTDLNDDTRNSNVKKDKEENWKNVIQEIESSEVKTVGVDSNEIHDLTYTSNVQDQQFAYWHKFGRDDVFNNCDGDFGFSLIDRWRRAGKEYCTADKKLSDSGYSLNPTLIKCHQISQTRHVAPDSFCHGYHLYLDMIQNNGPHNFRNNFFWGQCKKNPSYWGFNAFQLHLNDLMRMKLRTMSESSPNYENQCKKGVYKLEGRTIFISRDGNGNVFHSLADFLNTFVTILILNLDHPDHKSVSNNRIVFLDNHGDGPFFKLWEAFGSKGIYRSVEALRSEISSKMESEKHCKEIVEMEHAIFSIPGGSSFIWKDVWRPNECFNHHTVLSACVRYILNHFGLSTQRRRNQGDPIRVLFSSRSEKPNAKIGRKIVNEEKLVSILKGSAATDIHGNQISVDVNRVDFANIPILEQIRYMRETDVYVGMHGAGMTHLIWLPDEAVVVELFPKGWHQSSMRNLAKNLNKHYLSWQNIHSDKHVDPQHLWTSVDEREFEDIMKKSFHIVQSFYNGNGLHQK